VTETSVAALLQTILDAVDLCQIIKLHLGVESKANVVVMRGLLYFFDIIKFVSRTQEQKIVVNQVVGSAN